ncbi:glutaminyl-peptide cyclotransferase [Planctomycetota bacterium]
MAMMLLYALTTGTGSCQKQTEAQGTALYTYETVHTYPHDREAFTQGLIFVDGTLYEGTGDYGKSTLRRVDLATGRVKKQVHLPNHLWGEGLTLMGDRIYQLTYKAGLGYIYDRDSLNPLGQFKYQGEGWGLTHNGQHLIRTDGSEFLIYHDPNGFAEVKRVRVHDGPRPVARLNELEMINGQIYANIWQTEQIAIIDPADGRVTAWINLEGLKAKHPYADVLNGIAYDQQQDRLFVTGKLWSALYEVKLVPVNKK